MIEIKSGDIITDDEGSRYLYLGMVEQPLACLPYFIENGSFVEVFKFTPFLQNIDNIRVESHIDIDLFLMKCQISGREFHFDFDRDCLIALPILKIQKNTLELYTWKEKNKDRIHSYSSYVSSGKPLKSQFYYKEQYSDILYILNRLGLKK